MLERAARPVDLLVTDVVMPVMSGTDLAARVTDRSPSTRVLFVSGFVPAGSPSLRGAPLVAKPLRRAELLDAVHPPSTAPPDRTSDRAPGRSKGSGDEAVADAAHGDDVTRAGGVDLDLGAESVHVLAHRADALPLRLGVPHVAQELLAREHLARRVAQEREQIELATT